MMMMARPLAMMDVILFAATATAMVAAAFPGVEFDPVEECLPCVDLFSRLEAGPDGRLSQVVDMQQRGEPKSGTTMMGIRAKAILRHTCELLGEMYGSETCTFSTIDKVHELLFVPELAAADSACPCDEIDRVSITLQMSQKHTLPVEESCPWWHPNAIASSYDACSTFDGEIRSYADLLSCVEEAGCEVADTRLQFATLRDPRPMTVSAYFHRVNDKSRSVEGVTVDEYVRGYLAAACQWVALRYYLFEGVLVETSSVFWYDEAITDIVGWHLQWMKFAGLQLPMRAVDGMVESARALSSRSVNKHPGGTNSADRSWEDEVGVDVVRDAEKILRAYLPPVLLIRWGIEP